MLSLSIAGIVPHGWRLSPYPVRRRSGYLHASGDGKNSSQVRHPLRRPDVQGLASLVLIVLNSTPLGACQEAFQKMLSAAVGAAVGSISLRLRSLDQVCDAWLPPRRKVWQRHADLCRCIRISHHIAGDRVAFFPAKQITSLWKYEVSMFGITLAFIRTGSVFLLRIQSSENAGNRSDWSRRANLITIESRGDSRPRLSGRAKLD